MRKHIHLPYLNKQTNKNFPQKHAAPRGLHDYLSVVKSDLMDPKNRRKAVLVYSQKILPSLWSIIFKS